MSLAPLECIFQSVGGGVCAWIKWLRAQTRTKEAQTIDPIMTSLLPLENCMSPAPPKRVLYGLKEGWAQTKSTHAQTCPNNAQTIDTIFNPTTPSINGLAPPKRVFQNRNGGGCTQTKWLREPTKHKRLTLFLTSRQFFENCMSPAPLMSTSFYRSAQTIDTIFNAHSHMGGARMFPALLKVF